MIKAIIVDDEVQGRKLLKTLLQSYCPQVTIIDEAINLPEAIKSIKKNKPELVFLDIEMPVYSGLEIIDFFDEDEMFFSIIFTTAYSDHALKGYKLSAIDYLLKPIEGVELAQAVKRYQNRKSSIENEKIVEISSSTIAIPIAQSIKFFEVEKIMYLKAINSYTEIHFEDKTKIIVSRTLKNFETALVAYNQFQRCHKSYIVNRKFVKDYVKSDGGYLILSYSVEIPISPDRVQEFLSGSLFIRRK